MAPTTLKIASSEKNSPRKIKQSSPSSSLTVANVLGLYEDEKTAFFIDGANLYKAARSLNFDMDYKVLIDAAKNSCRLVRAYYYTTIQEDREADYSPLRPLIDWLDYNGYSMVTKVTREFVDSTGKRRFKGSTDIELVVDVMRLADKLDHIIIFSGNGDFARAVDAVKNMGVRVTVVSTVKSTPPMVSDDMRRSADTFVELENLKECSGRPVTVRPEVSDDIEDIDS